MLHAMRYLPGGQSLSLHVSVTLIVLDPKHVFPPFTGIGFVHVLVLCPCFIPESQVVEQAVVQRIADHLLQPPSKQKK